MKLSRATFMSPPPFQSPPHYSIQACLLYINIQCLEMTGNAKHSEDLWPAWDDGCYWNVPLLRGRWGGGGRFSVEESLEWPAYTVWLPGGIFGTSWIPFLPPLFTLLVKSTLLVVAGGAENSEALVTNCIFIFLNLFWGYIYCFFANTQVCTICKCMINQKCINEKPFFIRLNLPKVGFCCILFN